MTDGDMSASVKDVNLVTNFFQYHQAEQEQVQKRTFTNWVNAQLAKHKTPSIVQDLFQDLRDGHRLLDLLEVLSGQRMVRKELRGTLSQGFNQPMVPE
ncbi:hypothetical protein scyTo_0023234 [Scyliorhinus torazame]|uniref:Calponin-homology (CH) domain-containing protein n=1 Tax=Scyliorhinus torazame TaxID=75743 RepID=A0A401Q5X8_SCYTO|nr:hypothetical protein [Scyliorhinus torazame]